MKLFNRSDRQDKMRNEIAVAGRIRSLGMANELEDADPEAVQRRLRNMNYGSTNHQIAATRT